jgi:hypothetical protein
MLPHQLLVDPQTVIPVALVTPESEFSPEEINGHDWRAYIRPNGTLYWYSPQKKVVSDEHPQVIKLDAIPNISSSVLSGVSDEWEIFVARPSYFHFIHHKSQYMSELSQNFQPFMQQSWQVATHIGLSTSLRSS